MRPNPPEDFGRYISTKLKAIEGAWDKGRKYKHDFNTRARGVVRKRQRRKLEYSVCDEVGSE